MVDGHKSVCEYITTHSPSVMKQAVFGGVRKNSDVVCYEKARVFLLLGGFCSVGLLGLLYG